MRFVFIRMRVPILLFNSGPPTQYTVQTTKSIQMTVSISGRKAEHRAFLSALRNQTHKCIPCTNVGRDLATHPQFTISITICFRLQMNIVSIRFFSRYRGKRTYRTN